VGFLPTFFPPKGRFGYRPIHGKPVPVDALQEVILPQTDLPEIEEDAGLAPFLEAAMGRTAGADGGGVERIPLAAGSKHEEDGVHGSAVGHGGSVAAQRMGLSWGQERLDTLPQRVRDAPITTGLIGVGTVVVAVLIG
jgi:hypothetical protein